MSKLLNRRSLPLLAAAGVAGGFAYANRRRARKVERDNSPVGAFTDIDGVRLHYVEQGAGQPILLVHGNGVMAQDWIVSGLFDELAATNRVIAVDRPGFGHSSRPRGIRWTPERQAELLAALLERLDAPKALVVGHSLGTQVAAALALNHPARVAGLALLGGYFFPTPRVDALVVAGAAVPGLGDAFNRLFMPLLGEALRGPISRKIFAPAPIPDAWQRDFPLAAAAQPSRVRAGGADAAHMVPAARRMAERYGELAMPVAIIAGRGDRLVEFAQSERLHAVTPRSRLMLLDEVGHMVHYSAMQEVAAAIRLL